MPDETKHRVSLLDIVTRGDFTRITESGALRRFRPTGLDEQILSIADAAISRRVPTGLVLPVGGTNAGIILCAAILVAHVARTKKLAAQIAFMTKQLRLRSFYDSLHFRNQRVAEYFPRTLITADGTATDVGHRPLEFVGKTGRLHFATSVRSLGLFGHPLHGIVIEGHPDFEEAVPSLIRDASPHIPILYLASTLPIRYSMTSPFWARFGVGMVRAFASWLARYPTAISFAKPLKHFVQRHSPHMRSPVHLRLLTSIPR